MKSSAVQLRIVGEMTRGARLGWNSVRGCFELNDGASTRTVQGRTVNALEAAGLIVRDSVGDCALRRRGAGQAASTSSATSGKAVACTE